MDTKITANAFGKRTVTLGPDADLSGLNLSHHEFREEDLTGSDFSNSDLRECEFENCNLAGCNFTGAFISQATFIDCNLSGCSFNCADLDDIRDDLFVILSAVPAEVPGLWDALHEGRIDGSTYEGKCACLVGTIANVRGVDFTELDELAPHSDRPAECWFTGIRPGDTPYNSPVAEIVDMWLSIWAAENR